MRWQTCMLPRGLIWEEVAPPQYKAMTGIELGLSQNELVTVKEPLIKLHDCKVHEKTILRKGSSSCYNKCTTT